MYTLIDSTNYDLPQTRKRAWVTLHRVDVELEQAEWSGAEMREVTDMLQKMVVNKTIAFAAQEFLESPEPAEFKHLCIRRKATHEMQHEG